MVEKFLSFFYIYRIYLWRKVRVFSIFRIRINGIVANILRRKYASHAEHGSAPYICVKFALSTTKFPTALPQCQNTVGIPLKCAKKRSSNRVPVRTAQTPHTPANCFLLLSSSSSLLLAGAVDAHFIRTSNQHTSACASIGFQLCPFI